MVEPPGVVTGRYGTIGELFYLEEPFWPLNTTLFVKDFHGNDPKFTYYFLQRFDFESFSGKSGVPGVNRNDLHSEEVFFPVSIPEQQAIAGVLSDVDAAVVGLQRLIAKKRDLKQAVMTQLLTAQTRLPGFHGEWEVKRLGEEVWFQVGFPFRSLQFNKLSQGVRLIRNRDLKSNEDVLHYDGQYSVDYLVERGDLLVSMDGDFILATWNEEVGLLNQRVGRLVARTDVKLDFLNYYLRKPLKDIEDATASTTVKHLSHGNIENLELPLPKPAEQTAIAKVLSDMDAEITALQDQLDKTQQIKAAMMQELLTGRTRLKV
jgi:type I restriction enzyme S subunit